MNGCIILAAGSSSRMQQPKMLMDFGDTTFIQHIIKIAKQLNDTKVIVVTGCYHSLLQPILVEEKADVVYNETWANGMGSSIKAGINYLNKFLIDNTFILVCDQPYITIDLLNEMNRLKKTSNKGIIACSYNETFGTPVLFDKKYFELLSQLNGQHGAKKIVQQYLDDTALVNFPGGAIDVDTPEDYIRLDISK